MRPVVVLFLVSALLGTARAQEPELELVREVTCAELFGPGVYETSGVVRVGDRLLVVFDNTARIGSVSLELDPGTATLSDDTSREGFSDFEAITHDPQTDSLFVAVEGQQEGPRSWRPHVLRYDASLQRTHRWRIDHPLPSSNKGVEGLAFVRLNGRAHLLALLEGNHGSSGDEGRDPGHGRILVLAWDEQADDWRIVSTKSLPAQAAFVDYAGIDVEGERVAVVSQSSSSLWVGSLEGGDPGQVYRLPRQPNGELRYGRIEGVTWLSESRLAMVSDQERPRDRGKGRVEQAIHVFELPGATEEGPVASEGMADRIR
jgi:hypothetical protein